MLALQYTLIPVLAVILGAIWASSRQSCGIVPFGRRFTFVHRLIAVAHRVGRRCSGLVGCYSPSVPILMTKSMRTVWPGA
jgi:hypothetical protein